MWRRKPRGGLWWWGVCRGVARLAAAPSTAATAPRITGPGAVGRWPLGAGERGAVATSPLRRNQRGGAPRQSAAYLGLAAGDSGGGGGGGGSSRLIGCRIRRRRTHVPVPLGHGARGRSRHTSQLARPRGGAGGAAARGHAAVGVPAASAEHDADVWSLPIATRLNARSPRAIRRLQKASNRMRK